MILRIEMEFGDTFFLARNEAVFFAQPESRDAIGLLLSEVLFIGKDRVSRADGVVISYKTGKGCGNLSEK